MQLSLEFTWKNELILSGEHISKFDHIRAGKHLVNNKQLAAPL